MTAPLRQMRLGSVLNDTLLIGTLLSLVKLAGAAKVILTARVFGASDAMDAFFIALLLPTFFSEVIAGSLTIALVPALIAVREHKGREAASQLVETVAVATVAVLMLSAVFLAAAANWLLHLTASGFDEHKRTLAREMLLALLPFAPLSGISIVWRSVLNAERRFAIAAVAPAMAPILSIVLLLAIGRNWGAWVQVAGMLAGVALEIIILGIAVSRMQYSLRFRWHGWNPDIRQMFGQYAPALGMGLIAQGTIVIDQAMAAILGPGSVSALTYGTRLTTVILGVGGNALSTAVLPHFSRLTAREDWHTLRQTVTATLRLALLAGIPAAIALYFATPFLVRILFQKGAFGEGAAELVIAVQRASLVQIPFALLLAILLRFTASLRANHLFVPVALFSLASNAIGDYILLHRMGVAGIPLASAITAGFSSAGLLWFSRMRAKVQ